jgi:hypothetical protein
MNRTIVLSAVLLAAVPLMAADKDDVTGAAKKLGDSANYTWHTTVDTSGQFKPGPTDGKTEKDGYTDITFSFNDTTSEGLRKGTNVAVKVEGNWQSAEEALKDDGGGGGGFNPTRFLVGRMQDFKSPAEEAADLANGAPDLKLADGVYSGSLTEAAAKERMRFRRRRNNNGGGGPEITGAKGSVKFWVADGVLTKYSFSVQGHMSLNGNDIDIDSTTTTEIKDIGKTKVEVPDDAKKKISG